MRSALLDGSLLVRLVAVVCLGVFAVPSAGTTASDIDRVNSLLRRAEANLSSVTASIGSRTTPPRGSAAKLAASRLEQVIGDLNPAKELLEKIPAGTEGRDEAAARYTAAATEYNRLIAILNGGAAPANSGESADTVRLDYRQEEQLGNARFHVREVEGNANELTERTEALRKIDDQLSIDHRDVIALRAIVENARRKSGFAATTLDTLPENGAGVAPVRQRLVNADAKVVTAADYLNPLHERLQDMIDPANYPEFDADLRRVRELSIMYARPEILETQKDLAAEAFTQAGAARDECVRVIRKYARLIQQQTGQGKALEGTGNGFLRNHAEFLRRAETAKGVLPGKIREDLAQARQYAAEAVAAQKPMWFTGGIPQVMGFAEERVTLLNAIDASLGAELKAELDTTRADLKKQAEALRELIIRENTMPSDTYAGADRDAVIKVAQSGWKVQQPGYKLLKVRIPAEKWVRETKWTYSNGTWYFSDRSRLQVRLLVADHENDELAIDRPVNIWKDHQAGDSMIGVPLWGFEDDLQPSSYMLRSKIK